MILRVHLLEMIISAAAAALGLFIWISMNGSNSDIKHRLLLFQGTAADREPHHLRRQI
jgi:hypothetical protein